MMFKYSLDVVSFKHQANKLNCMWPNHLTVPPHCSIKCDETPRKITFVIKLSVIISRWILRRVIYHSVKKVKTAKIPLCFIPFNIQILWDGRATLMLNIWTWRRHCVKFFIIIIYLFKAHNNPLGSEKKTRDFGA